MLMRESAFQIELNRSVKNKCTNIQSWMMIHDDHMDDVTSINDSILVFMDDYSFLSTYY